TCPSSCTNLLTCGGNPNAPNTCSCSPNLRTCQSNASSGPDTVFACNSAGTSVTTSNCSNGCMGGSCCQSDASHCSNSRACVDVNYCGRTVQCSAVGSCATRYPGDNYFCNSDGFCECDPGFSLPCDGGSCDSGGTWVPGDGCPHATPCCCDISNS